ALDAEWSGLLLVCDELDAEHHPDAADLDDDRKLLQRLEALEERRAEVCRARQQSFALDNFQICERDGAGGGVAVVGVADRESALGADHLGDFAADEDRAERDV